MLKAAEVDVRVQKEMNVSLQASVQAMTGLRTSLADSEAKNEDLKKKTQNSELNCDNSPNNINCNTRLKPAAMPKLVSQNSGPVVAVRYLEGLPKAKKEETNGVELLRLRVRK